MTDVAFDTLKMAQGLKDAGMESKQAESVVTLMNNVINERIATKVDLEKLELRLTLKMFMMQTSFTVALFAALKLFL